MAIRSTSLCVGRRRRQTRPATVKFRLSKLSNQSQATESLPSLKRAHPARQAHQPLGPGAASRPQAGARWGKATGRSRRQVVPAVPAPKVTPQPLRANSGRPSSRRRCSAQRQQGARRARVLRDLRTGPRKKAQRRNSTASQHMPGSTPSASFQQAPLAPRPNSLGLVRTL